jgi:hypothetical protein
MNDAKHSAAGSKTSPARETPSLSVRDALVVLAIRLMGGDLRNNPSARQHIVALARATPLLMNEPYDASEKRIMRFVETAGTSAMDDLFAEALALLRQDHREEALQWAAANAVAQHQTDEMNAMLYHIGKALGFTAKEVEAVLQQTLRQSTRPGLSIDEPE